MGFPLVHPGGHPAIPEFQFHRRAGLDLGRGGQRQSQTQPAENTDYYCCCYCYCC